MQAERKLAKYLAVLVSETNKDFKMHANMFKVKPFKISENDPLKNRTFV